MGKLEVKYCLVNLYEWYESYLVETVKEAAQMDRALGVSYIVSKVEEFIETIPYRSQMSKSVANLFVDNFSLYLCGMMDAQREALENDKTKTA